MIRQVEVKISPEKVRNMDLIRSIATRKTKSDPEKVTDVKIVRRSLDARGSKPFFRLRCEVHIEETPQTTPSIINRYKDVNKATPVIVIGAGPAGYFAALELIEQGLKPIVVDRGKSVRDRRRDLRAIQQDGIVNPHSNYCFGEGGAGTYSDGKLYTRSLKRGNYIKVLDLLVEHGTNPDILIDAHPHIGSNKLPKIVSNIRATIENCGGEIHFDTHIEDFIVKENKLKGVLSSSGKVYEARAFILATGHSARDIYRLLYNKKIKIETKPFALGLRIEHPQSLIDKIQYNVSRRSENLPAASYKLVSQVDDKGVFSFCMCPGGLVVPAATAPGEIVVNGMSLSRRDSAFANSGVVTSIDIKDLHKMGYNGLFAAMKFQESVEKKMFLSGDGSQKAPAQRVTDFVSGKLSSDLNETSYIPGLFSAPLHQLLPAYVYQKLRKGLIAFNKKMKGYLTEEANVIGTESRTSAPIRIPRDKNTFMHLETEGLFPCGEGAGYAGGILSAAMDGQNVARAVKRYLG